MTVSDEPPGLFLLPTVVLYGLYTIYPIVAS
jgi:hypothetical protein